MSELDDFLTTILFHQMKAEEALHNGDPAPRMQMWSTQDPVTLLGAIKTNSGWDEVSQVFRWLGSEFSDCTSCTRLRPARRSLTHPIRYAFFSPLKIH
jgi:hypothetical protein